MNVRSKVFGIAFLLALHTSLFAQTSSIPQLDSRPGAAYTFYLNFGGFNYSGTWGSSSSTPGNHTAYDTNGDPSTFSATEISNMQSIWTRTAEKYAAFNINVTTIDPAAAGSTFAQRQAFYESQQRFMHTVIGRQVTTWSGGGGVSYLGVASGAGTPSGNSGAGAGFKTNWAFSTNGGGAPKSIAEAITHENGHALGLEHQAKWTNSTTLIYAYDDGLSGTTQNTAGIGSQNSARVSPIMGVGYYTDRSAWRVGAIDDNSSVNAQNDVRVIQSTTENPGIRFGTTTGFAEDGIGHTLATATTLPTTGTTINTALAKGIITPLDSNNPNPIGAENYTKDLYKLVVEEGGVGSLNVTLNSGRSTITAGVADPGATLNATLRLLDASETQLQISNGSVFTETISASNLAAGTYYLEVTSAGGFTDTYGNRYYDMGSYFLSGSFVPVPEPATVLGVGAAVLAVGGFVRRRWKRGTTADMPAIAV